jgi:hypothetical protein
VEQGYGICGARDEPAHAGQQQQLVDQLGHDSPPPGVAPAKPQLGAGTLVPRRHPLHCRLGRFGARQHSGSAPRRSAHSITSSAIPRAIQLARCALGFDPRSDLSRCGANHPVPGGSPSAELCKRKRLRIPSVGTHSLGNRKAEIFQLTSNPSRARAPSGMVAWSVVPLGVPLPMPQPSHRRESVDLN